MNKQAILFWTFIALAAVGVLTWLGNASPSRIIIPLVVFGGCIPAVQISASSLGKQNQITKDQAIGSNHGESQCTVQCQKEQRLF